MALNQIISEGIKDGEVKAADIAVDAVGITDLSATGTASSSTFLRGDNAWATPPDTIVGGSSALNMDGANITLQDSASSSDDRIILGAGSDFNIYHDGTDSHIRNNEGKLIITNNDSGGDDLHLRGKADEESIVCLRDSGVEIYFNDAKKFETVTGGATITGVCTATSFAGDGSSLTGLQAGATGGNSGANAVFWENEQTVTHDYTISNNKNAGTWGPVTINSGVTVTVGDGEYWTIM